MDLLEFIKYFIYLLFSFDTNYVYKRNLRGGSTPATPAPATPAPVKPAPVTPVTPATPAAATATAVKKSEGTATKPEGNVAKNTANTDNSGSKTVNNKISNIEESENAEQIVGQNLLSIIVNEIKTAAIIAITWIKSKIMFWIVVPVLFASLSPAIPFFGVMAFMAATMKYFMWHFRKL
jgi:hypothetical protein